MQLHRGRHHRRIPGNRPERHLQRPHGHPQPHRRGVLKRPGGQDHQELLRPQDHQKTARPGTHVFRFPRNSGGTGSQGGLKQAYHEKGCCGCGSPF